jgi:hypothetical protein
MPNRSLPQLCDLLGNTEALRKAREHRMEILSEKLEKAAEEEEKAAMDDTQMVEKDGEG